MPNASLIASEQDGLVKSLVSVLTDANWKPETPVPSGFTKGLGIHVTFSSASSATCKAAAALVEALRKVPLTTTSDLACNGPMKATSEEGTIFLIVELK